MTELKFELLCELVGDLYENQEIGSTPYGIRMIAPVAGGEIKGPKLNGEALSPGADWFLIRNDGVGEIDARFTIRTNDGELIYTYYRGILNMPPEIMERIQNGEDVDPSEYYLN